jgi:hypothetical protein
MIRPLNSSPNNLLWARSAGRGSNDQLQGRKTTQRQASHSGQFPVHISRRGTPCGRLGRLAGCRRPIHHCYGQPLPPRQSKPWLSLKMLLLTTNVP